MKDEAAPGSSLLPGINIALDEMKVFVNFAFSMRILSM
jgi:hypothetical protein